MLHADRSERSQPEVLELLHHLRPARLHPGCEVDEGYSGFNFIFKGYFSTMGMSILWPIRVLQDKSTGART